MNIDPQQSIFSQLAEHDEVSDFSSVTPGSAITTNTQDLPIPSSESYLVMDGSAVATARMQELIPV